MTVVGWILAVLSFGMLIFGQVMFALDMRDYKRCLERVRAVREEEP